MEDECTHRPPPLPASPTPYTLTLTSNSSPPPIHKLRIGMRIDTAKRVPITITELHFGRQSTNVGTAAISISISSGTKRHKAAQSSTKRHKAAQSGTKRHKAAHCFSKFIACIFGFQVINFFGDDFLRNRRKQHKIGRKKQVRLPPFFPKVPDFWFLPAPAYHPAPA